MKGQYEAFLGGENRSEKLPDSYRKQLLTNLRQFIEQQKKEHEGIDSVSLLHLFFSEKDSTASAFSVVSLWRQDNGAGCCTNAKEARSVDDAIGIVWIMACLPLRPFVLMEITGSPGDRKSVYS